MTVDWPKVAADGRLETLKVGQLKEYLKSVGISQTGEKGTLIFRIKSHIDGEKLKLDGTNPAIMRLPDLRKACATRGLSPLGYPDELLEALMNHLRTKGTGNGGASKGEDGGDAGSKDAASGDFKEQGDAAVQLGGRVIELSEEERWASILSLAGQEVTRASPTAVMRKAYHRLSLLLHPDRMRGFPDATKAFQALVTAFERLQEPELEEEEVKRGKGAKARAKARTIARSNENCFRTTVLCPRCRQEWGLPIDGLPPYAYNYLMQCLKTYHCSTCLLEFGALTAVHLCPHCRHEYEYDPMDYHRQITCTSCHKRFGFMLYTVSDRVEKEMRQQLKAEQEQRLRAREAKLGRLARSNKRKAHRGEDAHDDEDRRLKERMFVQGLLDECPRCGEPMECDSDNREAHQEHLKSCRDTAKIQAHSKRQKVEAAKREEAAAKQAAQEDMQSLRTWEFLGADLGGLWLLTDEQLAKQCQEQGMKTRGQTKDQMIARLVEHRRKMDESRLLTDGSESGRVTRGSSTTRLTRESLPSNLHCMSVAQLKAVCAAHRIPSKSRSQAGIIKEIEAELAKAQEDQVYLIEG